MRSRSRARQHDLDDRVCIGIMFIISNSFNSNEKRLSQSLSSYLISLVPKINLHTVVFKMMMNRFLSRVPKSVLRPAGVRCFSGKYFLFSFSIFLPLLTFFLHLLFAEKQPLEVKCPGAEPGTMPTPAESSAGKEYEEYMLHQEGYVARHEYDCEAD